MRILLGAILLGWAIGALAFGDYEDYSQHSNQIAVQVAKAKASAEAGGGSVTTGSVEHEAAAIAPNPYAHAPSAQCRYGWSVTGAGVGFGAGVSASEWDKICGLWMAAQQTTGEAQKEAAAAAFCLTMKDAGVQSKVCETWGDNQRAQVEMNSNRAAIVFGGSGTSAVVATRPDN